jgi:hypothetical protein
MLPCSIWKAAPPPVPQVSPTHPGSQNGGTCNSNRNPAAELDVASVQCPFIAVRRCPDAAEAARHAVTPIGYAWGRFMFLGDLRLMADVRAALGDH